MSELIDVLQDHPAQPRPELFPERALMESLRPQQIHDFIEECEYKRAELVRLEALARDVLSGYGESAA